MRAHVLSISDLGPRDLAAWRQLGATSVSPNPFFEPDFVLPATKAWGVDDVGMLIVRDRADWLAAVPVRKVHSWRRTRGRFLTAWRHDYCYLSNPLVADADAEAILATLVRGGVQETGRLAIDWIDVDGPLDRALHSAAIVVTVEQFERAALCRREDGDYLETLSSRHRREYRRKLRRLESELGTLTLRDDSHDPAAYTRFLELESSGWKGAAGTGTAMACRPGHGEFFIEICKRLAGTGRLELLSLASEDRIVAMQSNFTFQDMTLAFKIAFDEQYARFSPGIQMELANIDHFHANGWTWSDSCSSPENATLNRLWSGRRQLRSILATRRDAAGTLTSAKWQAAIATRPIRRRLRQLRGEA